MPLMKPVHIKGFAAALPDFIGSMFTMDGLTTLTALGVAVYLLKLFGLALFGQALFIGYMMSVIQAAAQGAQRLPDPVDFLDVGSVIMPVVRFILALSYVWLPGVLYISFVTGWSSLYWDGPVQLLMDPILLVLLAAGIVLFPISMVVAAVSESVLAVLDLRIAVRIVNRIPAAYAAAAAASLAVLLVGQVMSIWTTMVVLFLPIPLLPGIVAEMINAPFWLVPGWILGRMIYQNHQHFGVMLAGADQEPEWPDAVPRGAVAPEGSLTHRRADAGEVEGWSGAPLTRAAETIGEAVTSDWRQIDAPKREVAPIEIDGWAERPADGQFDAMAFGVAPLVVPTGPPSPPVDAPRAAPPPARQAPTPSLDLRLTDDLQLDTGPVSHLEGLELEFEDEVTEGLAPRPPNLSAPAPVPMVGGAPSPAALGAAQPGTPSPTPARVVAGRPLVGAGDASSFPAVPAVGYGAAVASPPASPVRPTSTEGPGRPSVQGPAPASVVDPGSYRSALEAALTKEPGVAALAAFVKCRDAGIDIQMDPRLELRLATTLERAREYPAAVAACRRAADQDLSGPFAPRAIYMAAQIYETRLRDMERAAGLYRYLVETYPADPLAARSDDAVRRLK